ncbi:MAG: thioesterase domain-containing protein [Acidobacteria bacterium]|nr:thioesterase domain-containing protein [Acidobacteriota bacterium]
MVVVKESNVGEQYLCAYFIQTQGTENMPKIPANTGLKEYLSLILPAYMVPTHFIALEKIPLTPSGKLDRKALPGTADSTPCAGYVAPVNEVEEKLTQIWANILGIEKNKISTNENFFELGGTSMGLIRQISLIYKDFEYEATANQIYLNPTIQAIAKSIISKKYVDEPVALLNQPGQKILFFFPPGVSYGVSYQALANIMSDYSIYSFNFIENENRLNEYVEIITTIQKTGPYVLAGWSAAGKLIFEVAGMLEYHNREVSDIIVIDSLIRENITMDNEKLDEMLSKLIQDVQESLEKQGLEFILEKVKKKAEKYINYNSNTGDLGVINAKVHFILSENSQNNPKLDIKCWDKRSTKPVEIYNGFGNHSEMLLPGLPLEKNAELIKNILDRIQNVNQLYAKYGQKF